MRRSCIELSAPSRLHFGLVAWGIDPMFRVGGAGVILNEPRVLLRIQAAPRITVKNHSESSISSTRLFEISQHVIASMRSVREGVDGILVELLEAPQPHIGLGTGTAIALGIAQGAALAYGLSDLPADVLSRWTGRGKRSGIGLHGFHRGGLILDGGRRDEDQPPPMVAHVQLPESWRILLVLPDAEPGVHGTDEDRVFQELSPPSDQMRARASALLEEDLVSAAQRSDLESFSLAVEEIQSLVGQTFESVQGGLYARAISASVVDAMRQSGLKAVGQSSWGPLLFGFASDVASMSGMLDRFRDTVLNRGIQPHWIRIVAPASQGYRSKRVAI